MSEKVESSGFTPLNIAVLTVSDTRDLNTDSSGKLLVNSVIESGHRMHDRSIVIDDIYKIRAVVSQWIADTAVHVVLITGGTGFANRDSTPEAVSPLFDKSVEGFGELFRDISCKKIGSSTIQSRALAGLSNKTLIFCLPGSNNACRTGWEKIIEEQLDSRTRPCNFAELLTGG